MYLYQVYLTNDTSKPSDYEIEASTSYGLANALANKFYDKWCDGWVDAMPSIATIEVDDVIIFDFDKVLMQVEMLYDYKIDTHGQPDSVEHSTHWGM